MLQDFEIEESTEKLRYLLKQPNANQKIREHLGFDSKFHSFSFIPLGQRYSEDTQDYNIP
jgi:hypothetical protein